jgi:hypothetical protein
MADTSKFEKEFRILFTAVALAVLLQAFSQVDTSALEGVSLDVNPYSLEDISTEDYTQQEITAQVEKSIEDYLSENGLSCKDISVGINITEDGSISIISVTLTVDDFPRAKELLLQSFGEGITVLER